MFFYLGDSVYSLIFLIGVMGGIGTAFICVYPMIVVARAFRQFRPMAIASVNLGSPIASLIMPPVASFLLNR